MYAVVQAGGHQYRVSEGEEVVIDYVEGKVGDKLTLDKVLMIGGDKTAIGSPMVSGAAVEATIKEQGRHDKILVFKYKRRKNYKKTQGHRQPYTLVGIDKIKH